MKHYEISMPADAAGNKSRNISASNLDIAYGNLHDAFQYAGLVKFLINLMETFQQQKGI